MNLFGRRKEVSGPFGKAQEELMKLAIERVRGMPVIPVVFQEDKKGKNLMDKRGYWTLEQKSGQKVADEAWQIAHPGTRSPAQKLADQVVMRAGKGK